MGSVTLIGRLAELRDHALGALRTMVRKEAQTGKAEPPTKVLEALNAAGISPQKYDEMLGLHKRHEELRQNAAGLDAAGSKLASLRKQLHEHRDATQRLLAPRRAEESKLVGEVREAAATLDDLQGAARRLQEFETSHGPEIGVEVPDLGGFSLTSGPTYENGSRSSLPGSPGAPSFHVSPEVFQREAARRHRLVVAAQARARRAYLAAFQEWSGRQPKGLLGRVIPKSEPPAEPAPITWADVASGRVPPVTDADLAHPDVAAALGERRSA